MIKQATVFPAFVWWAVRDGGTVAEPFDLWRPMVICDVAGTASLIASHDFSN